MKRREWPASCRSPAGVRTDTDAPAVHPGSDSPVTSDTARLPKTPLPDSNISGIQDPGTSGQKHPHRVAHAVGAHRTAPPRRVPTLLHGPSSTDSHISPTPSTQRHCTGTVVLLKPGLARGTVDRICLSPAVGSIGVGRPAVSSLRSSYQTQTEKLLAVLP
jgi:hypothetical protein